MKGANILNYTEFKDFKKDDTGKITSVYLKDLEANQTFEVKTRTVVNCTGVHSDKICKLDDSRNKEVIIASEGTHVILPKSYVNDDHGLIIPKTKDGRVIFILPYQNKALVGTTDNVYEEKTNHPVTD